MVVAAMVWMSDCNFVERGTTCVSIAHLRVSKLLEFVTVNKNTRVRKDVSN